jgi:hypothetical protein
MPVFVTTTEELYRATGVRSSSSAMVLGEPSDVEIFHGRGGVSDRIASDL